MTEIKETLAVPLPATTVQANLNRFFDARRSENGTVEMGLRVPLADFGIPGNLSLEHDVDVAIQKRRDAENINDELSISWVPVDNGPYPSFVGRLIIWGEERPEESYMQLDGLYKPPGGAAGTMFDAAIGHLIAQRTAHSFLETLRNAAIDANTLLHT